MHILCSERTTLFIKCSTNISYRARGIIRRCFYNNRNSMRRHTLIDHFFKIHGILSRSLFDRCFNTILRHLNRLSILYRPTERRVSIRIRTTLLYSECNVPTGLGELLSHSIPPSEFSLFTIFKCTSHSLAFNLIY